eukprot:5694387-Amphidinium_carterae.1
MSSLRFRSEGCLEAEFKLIVKSRSRAGQIAGAGGGANDVNVYTMIDVVEPTSHLEAIAHLVSLSDQELEQELDRLQHELCVTRKSKKKKQKKQHNNNTLHFSILGSSMDSLLTYVKVKAGLERHINHGSRVQNTMGFDLLTYHRAQHVAVFRKFRVLGCELSCTHFRNLAYMSEQHKQ